MSGQEAGNEEFERGRRFERCQRLLFQGVPITKPWSHGVEFESNGSWFESCVAYERNLRIDRRRIQRGLWMVGKDGGDSARDQTKRLEDAEAAIVSELWKARNAVNEELRERRGRPYAVAAMRVAPQRPGHVLEFPDLDAFVAQDERRAIADWPDRRDAGGADYGGDWQFENPFRRWETTRWRVSWLCEGEQPTHEVYALESLPTSGAGKKRRPGRVWLLGELPSWAMAAETLGEIQRDAEQERNSLVLAAKAIQAPARNEKLDDLGYRLALENS